MNTRYIVEKIVFMLSLGQEVLSGRYERVRDENKKKLTKFSNVWKDPSLPGKQYVVVKKQIEKLRSTKYLEMPFKPAVDLIKKTGLRNPTVLEIGCSSGYYNEVFKLSGLKVDYYGCDYSPSFIKFAKKTYPSIDFRVEDARNLRYKNKQFQIGLSGCCILHIKEYEQAIAETARISKDFMIFHRTPVIQMEKTTFYKKVGYGLEMVEIIFNESELIELFAKYGFGLVSSIVITHSQISGLNEPVIIKSFLVKRIK